MLPAAARLTRGADITRTVRRGARGSRPGVTVHLLHAPPAPSPAPASAAPPGPAPTPVVARATVVTPRAVGTAVARNLVRRRLRHLLRPELVRLPAGSTLVVRADARASTLGATALSAALTGALDAARARADRVRAP